MTEIFSYPYKNLDGSEWNTNLISGPVIINSSGKILLHIWSSTGKYQFIWGRMNDNSSLRENAINRAEEVLWHRNITLENLEPLCVTWEIERDWKSEKITLFHYQAKLDDETDIWEAEWKSLDEIEELWKQNMLSSQNIIIASKYFLEK